MVMFNSYVKVYQRVWWNFMGISFGIYCWTSHGLETCRTSGSYTHLIFVKQKLGRSALLLAASDHHILLRINTRTFRLLVIWITKKVLIAWRIVRLV